MSRAKRTSQQESSQQPVRSGPPVGPPGDVSRRSFLATGASMAGAALVGGALPATAAAAETDVPGTARHPRPGGLRPSTTTLEYAERPLPTDVRAPRFGWAFPEGTSGSQSGYRIRVATSADRLRAGRPDVWDSGEVRSSATGDIAYAGDDLAPRTGYCWQVRTRDAQGRDGGWSRIGEFETALVDEGWGDARWIGRAEPDVPDVDLAAASWIWEQGSTADGGVLGTRYLRGSVDLPAGLQVSAASLVMTADDDFTGWLQGSQVLEQPQQKDAWRTARQVDVTDVVTAAVGSTLVLAARVTNRGGATVNPGALLAVLTVTTASGDELTLVTDESWRLAESPGSGWEQPDFDDSDWDSAAVMAPYGQGPWGSGVSLAVPTAPAPLLRREFTVERDVVRARLYLSAGGYAVATINGRRVTDDVLEPGFTDYDDTVLYVVHDVTSRIRRGRNVIGAELGRGFFGMTTSNAWNWNQAPWHGEPRMLARLVMTHRDGSTTDVVSDQRWTMSDGPTTVDNLYAGESHDTRLVPRGWDTTAGDVDGWVAATPVDAPRGRLVAQQHEPIRVVDTVAPVSLTSPAAGVWVADFGRTAAGWTRLRMSLPAGTTVRLTHGETLAHDGTVEASNGNAPGRCQVDEFTAAEGDRVQEWEPRFTYHGFRYVQLDGLPGRPPAGSVHLRVVHSDIPDDGTFRCSEPLLETFEAMMRRTVHNNLHGLPTDTPMYEKNGWTGDAQVAAPTMAAQLGMHRLFTKWLGDLRDSQLETGQPAVIVPSGGWGYTQLAPAPEWTTVYPYLLREMHRWYGDRRVLAEHHDAVLAYLDWELDRLVDGLPQTALGDYLSPGTGGNPPEDARLTASCYLIRALRATAETGGIIGRTDAVARLRAAADALQDRMNDEFLDRAAGHYRTARDPEYRQTSNAIPLAFDLVPEGFSDSVFTSLVDDIEARGGHLNTGCLGTSVLLPVLTRFGRSDLAFTVALQRTYPSWGYWVDNGADTMWEFWQIPGRSRDHYFQGTVVQWLHENVAGLRPVADGWRQLTIRPDARGALTTAAHSVRTVRGTAAVSWRRRGRAFVLSALVPLGSTAEIHVPAESAGAVRCTSRTDRPTFRDGYAVFRVGGGRWTFESRLAAS